MIKTKSKSSASKDRNTSSSKVGRLQTKRQHKLLTHSRILRYGVRNFTRNSWLTVVATVVMVITLLIMFATIAISQMLNSTVVSLREKIDISIYLKPSISDDTLRNLKGKMQLVDNVRSVSVSNSQSEYDAYIDQIKSDPEKISVISTLSESGVKPEDKFPAIMHVKVNDLTKLDPIKKMVSDDPQFKEWTYEKRAPSYAGDQQDTINRIASWASFAQRSGLIAGAIFLTISILVIFNTIRMAIFSRRDEIEMMKSVGADSHFIRGPFLIEAQMYGFFAAILATALGYLLFMWIAPGLEEYGVVINDFHTILVEWVALIFAAMIAAGVAIGYISARFAVRKYLK